jgi:hypothetical protein
MTPKIRLPRGFLAMQILFIATQAAVLQGQDKTAAGPDVQSVGTTNNPANFNNVADKALSLMQKRAEELNIKGVALVAYAEGDTVKAWSSKMVVVGNMTSDTGPNKKGNNLLGIAYSKAAEMAETLKDSGSKSRPSMLGENGYQGGLVTKTKTGIVFAAFSGGPAEDDLKVSHAGLEAMAKDL